MTSKVTNPPANQLPARIALASARTLALRVANRSKRVRLLPVVELSLRETLRTIGGRA